MLTFTKVTYQNFLASGNAPITIELSQHSTNLVIGQNGTGKSTLSEAICFAAFGRPLRNINKPKLVNSINQHDCLVELSFTAQNTSYLVRRGIKPSVFEIYADDNLIPQPAAVADYQTLLETQILKLNYKSFMQVVVLGNSSYVPFMRLTAAARREIIEDLLDIEIFSSMNALAKEDLLEVKGETEKASVARNLVSEQVKMAQSFTEQVKEQQEQAIANLEASLVTTCTQIQHQSDEKDELEQQLGAYAHVIAEQEQVNQKVSNYEKTLSALQARQRKLHKEHTFYQDHDSCPTCEQTIDAQFKLDRETLLKQKQQEVAEAVDQCQGLLTKYENKQEENSKQIHNMNLLRWSIDKLVTEGAMLQRRSAELTREIEAHREAPVSIDVDVEKLQHQLASVETQHEALSHRRVIIDAASMLLKDSGIKTRIIRHYLPIINKTINHYLNAMDFPVLFTLDEEFVEHIKSRYRDDFDYNSFSEGEKKRIDLALLLTWRTVAALKNSAATNLLILDEVFDSSLDVSGTDEFMKIIAGLEKNTNVFVISHKSDQLIDKFAHVITFEKVRGFSQVKV
jgi:DNA repair exonuclease SbcCD ATPase subunit